MIRLTPIPCVHSARRLTRCDLPRDHPDVAHRPRTKVVRKGSNPYAPAVGQHQLPGYRATRANFAFRPASWNVLMTAGPNTNSTECNREKLVNALPDEALIKQLEAAIYSNEIWEKALDVVRKRIASREVSDNMLLHVAVSLSKSTAVLSCTAERRRS